MASKDSKLVTTRQHSKSDGASINRTDSILINEEDLYDTPLLGKVLSQNFKELSVQVNSKMEETRTLMLLLFASSSDFFPLTNPVVLGLGRRTSRSCLLA